MSRRPLRTILFVLLVLTASACGGEFLRDDAVASLRAGGADDVTATCMADTLRMLDELSAAEPGRALGTAERNALIAARDRCATGSTPTETERVEETLTVERPNASLGLVQAGRAPEELPPPAEVLGDVETSSRADARQRLLALGRAPEWADCILDRLVDLGAEDLFDLPTLGLGATPEEATAFVLCS